MKEPSHEEQDKELAHVTCEAKLILCYTLFFFKIKV